MCCACQMQPGGEQAEEEHEEQLERSVQPITPSSSAADVPSTGRLSSEPLCKKKKSSEEEKAMEAVKTYFLQKTASSTSIASAAQSSVADVDDKEQFGRMIAAEMRHIKTLALKREVLQHTGRRNNRCCMWVKCVRKPSPHLPICKSAGPQVSRSTFYLCRCSELALSGDSQACLTILQLITL